MFGFLKKFLFSLVLSVAVVLLFLVSKTGINQTITDHILYGTNENVWDKFNIYLGNQLSAGKSKRIRNNIKQIAVQQDAQKQANRLLNVMLTYDDSDEYNHRADKAKALAEAPVLTSPDLFGSDINNGVHLVNARKLHSKFISSNVSIEPISTHGNLVNVMIYSKSLHWKGTQDKRILTALYVGTFDFSLEKYRQLAYVQTISDKYSIQKYA